MAIASGSLCAVFSSRLSSGVAAGSGKSQVTPAGYHCSHTRLAIENSSLARVVEAAIFTVAGRPGTVDRVAAAPDAAPQHLLFQPGTPASTAPPRNSNAGDCIAIGEWPCDPVDRRSQRPQRQP